MKSSTLNDKLPPQSLSLFERMVTETFGQKKLGENTSDMAQMLFSIEKFLVYFAKQKEVNLETILYDKKFVRSKLRFYIHHFWSQLANIDKFPRDNKLRYSESIETLWLWYEENKVNIDTIITIPKSERLDEKYKNIIKKNLKQLHAKLNRKEHKTNITNRINIKNSNVEKITRYINRLSVMYPNHTVIRIELGYEDVKLFDKKVSQHISHFHHSRRHKPTLFKKLCGYIAKLEFSYYNGCYWRMLLFFHGLDPDDTHIYSRNIGEYWNNIIVKKGGDYLTQDDYLKVEEDGIELLENRLCATFFSEPPLDAARYLCEKDAICRPNVGIVKLLRTGQISTEKKAKVASEIVPRGRRRHIDRENIALLKQQGLGATEIAKQLGISRSAVYKLVPKSKS